MCPCSGLSARVLQLYIHLKTNRQHLNTMLLYCSLPETLPKVPKMEKSLRILCWLIGILYATQPTDLIFVTIIFIFSLGTY